MGRSLRAWGNPVSASDVEHGKTTLCAGLAAASLDGPLALPRGETVPLPLASSFDQGKIAFNHVLAFLRVKHDLEDRSSWRVWDSSNKAEIA